MVEPLPPGRTLPARVSAKRGWRIAPGVHYQRWNQTNRRGPIRAHLITVDLRKRGVSLDYASRRYVPDRGPLGRLVRGDRAVAGVNGGFFDIHDTGAPLGVGVDRQRGFLHAARYTWRNAFYITRGGAARIGADAAERHRRPVPADGRHQRELAAGAGRRHRRLRARLGQTSGYRITDGQTKARADGRDQERPGDREPDHRLNSGKLIDATVLVGRGPGAEQLEQMRVGSTATVRWGLAGRPPFAISGESVLLRGARCRSPTTASCTRAPPSASTATGPDAAAGRRRPAKRSRGYTLVELARMMRRLGAEDALNLDGGGSSTMVGRTRAGKLALLNRASDGRSVRSPTRSS